VLDLDPAVCCVKESATAGSSRTATSLATAPCPNPLSRPAESKTERDHCDRSQSSLLHNQPALPKAEWEAEVDKMRVAYNTPIDAKDLDAILDYVVSISGVK
jgi:hypothetical protein